MFEKYKIDMRVLWSLHKQFISFRILSSEKEKPFYFN